MTEEKIITEEELDRLAREEYVNYCREMGIKPKPEPHPSWKRVKRHLLKHQR